MKLVEMVDSKFYKTESMQEVFDLVNSVTYTKILDLLETFGLVEGGGLCDPNYDTHVILVSAHHQRIAAIMGDCYSSLCNGRSKVRRNMYTTTNLSPATIFVTPFIVLKFSNKTTLDGVALSGELSNCLFIKQYRQSYQSVLGAYENFHNYPGLKLSERAKQDFATEFWTDPNRFFITPLHYDKAIDFQFTLETPCSVTYRLFRHLQEVTRTMNNSSDFWTTCNFVEYMQKTIFEDEGSLG